jgi:transcriptional regulator of acetoin/glycerol metabolism
METEHIHKVVDKCHGNISKAAELLGITRQTLYAKIKK